ncbi:hypothetical protein [Nitrosococcus wardiae]|uniref:Uncharacterized protein n=1 Tax=Nitrosococcus wardiae TaxID=1814290 RepID=A0A4P7C135_9GAMM|nr:hypothetical protein [Nitrosococcus wardiae]QBQ56091.1 hypothetical protein E3U44_17425 [Nitrosococcus wardiae]
MTRHAALPSLEVRRRLATPGFPAGGQIQPAPFWDGHSPVYVGPLDPRSRLTLAADGLVMLTPSPMKLHLNGNLYV